MVPTYIKVLKYLEDLILSGKLSAGDKIPSENELARMFDTTRVTVRKALDELEKKRYNLKGARCWNICY